MKRLVVAAGVLVFGISAAVAQQNIAVQQDNLMRAQAKSLYSVIWKMVKGDIPYNQAAIDHALAELDKSVGTIAEVFTPNPKEDVVDATYGASQKIWQNKADFDSRIPPVTKAIRSAKSTVKNAKTLKAAYEAINAKCNDCHETYRIKLK